MVAWQSRKCIAFVSGKSMVHSFAFSFQIYLILKGEVCSDCLPNILLQSNLVYNYTQISSIEIDNIAAVTCC